MTPLFRKIQWWLRRRRGKRSSARSCSSTWRRNGETPRRRAACRRGGVGGAARLGNTTLLREDARASWSWLLLEQLAQDVRYGVRGMAKNRLFTVLAALSLALGIGANTAIYSFMDAILLRSLPVADPASLIVVKWHSDPVNFGSGRPFVLHSIDGSTYRRGRGHHRGHLSVSGVRASPRSVVAGPLQPVRAQAGRRRERDRQGRSRARQGQYVSGGFFRGLAVVPAAGRLIQADDDRAGAAPVAVLSAGYSQRRFGDADRAIGQAILINSVTFTVVGVAPPEFFGVDPARPRRSICRCAPARCSKPTASAVFRPELLLGRDDGAAEARRRPRAARRPRWRGRSRSGSLRRRPTIASAPIFLRCVSRRAPRDSTA